MADKVDPKLTAERLLQQVLPADEYLHLCAHGWFEVRSPDNSYRIFKGKKTHVTRNDGSVHSCCIAPSDIACPEQDRIVAEYLLILNDEKRYLDTANLTRVSAPTGSDIESRVAAFRYRIGALMDQAAGDVIMVRRPPYYLPRAEQFQYDLPWHDPRSILRAVMGSLSAKVIRGVSRQVYLYYTAAETPRIVIPSQRELLHVQIDNLGLLASFEAETDRVAALLYAGIFAPPRAVIDWFVDRSCDLRIRDRLMTSTIVENGICLAYSEEYYIRTNTRVGTVSAEFAGRRDLTPESDRP